MTKPMNPKKVQQFLDDLLPCEHFLVVFLTSKGEQRQYMGFLVPDGTRNDLVRFQTIEGPFKAFKIDSVLSLTKEGVE